MAKMKTAQTVYYGPSSSGYPSVGSVSANEPVDYFWVEGTWCYIHYSVSGSSNKKCGYVRDTAVNHSGESPLIYNDNNSGTRYIRSGGTTYTGPGGSGYVQAGSVDAGESVTYTGYKYNNYALIEYGVTGSSNKKRAWYSASDMTTEPVASNNFYDYVARGWTVTNPWNGNPGYNGHLGLDLAVNGYTTYGIPALADGVVVGKSTDCRPSNGWTIVLQHTTSNKIFYSFYAHMASASSLSLNTRVLCGEIIGYYGDTGRVSGPHLHLGVYTGDMNVDQYGYYRENDTNVSFDDGGTGTIYYMGYQFYNPAKIISGEVLIR